MTYVNQPDCPWLTPDAVAHGMAIAKAFAVSANLVDFAKAFAAANPSYVPGNIATEDGSRPFW